MSDDCQQLVEAYLEWLRESITVTNLGDVCEITTPFLDRHNDRLQIYVEQTATGYRLSDDGYVLSDLEVSGCGVNTPHRKELLRAMLNGFGVTEAEEELFVHSTRDNFPKKKHAILQAMMAVNDMFMTGRHFVSRFFLEDVSQYLDENEVRYSPNVEFTGRSGFTHRYDFVIPRSSTKSERLIRAINNPNKDAATQLIFSWTDTKQVRPAQSQAIAILNDLERDVSSDIIAALAEYQIGTILWTHRDDHAAELAA